MFHIKNYQKAAHLLHIQVRYSRSNPFVPILQKKVQPVLYYSFNERQAEKNKKLQDEEKLRKVNIGFSPVKLSGRNNIEKQNILRALKKDVSLEKEARECTLKVDLNVVEKEWISSIKPTHIKVLAEHYGIFKDLFGEYSFFYPMVHMDIFYESENGTASPVFVGNLLKPAEASTSPRVEFESKPDTLWSLVLTNPDGNLFQNESEILHWFVGNIRGGKVREGEEIVDYMRPIPPKGTGFHRFCFLLYKQSEKIDFSEYKRKVPCISLKERTFKTFDFYKQFEDHLTPVGLSWFEADYDSSLTDFFHHTLRMQEPFYEYEFPKPYVRPQKFFPHLRPFNRYMDLHRDPKETQKLMLIKRLARVHPFKGEPPLLPFPQAVPIQSDLPIWMKNEIKYERDGERKYRHMYRGDDRPYIKDGKYKHPPVSKL